MSSPSPGKRLSSVVEATRAFAEVATDEPRLLEVFTERLSEVGRHCSVRLAAEDLSRWTGGVVYDADAGYRSVGQKICGAECSLDEHDELGAVVRTERSFSGPCTTLWTSELLRALELGMVACLPFRTPSGVLGAVTLGRRPPANENFDEDDLAYTQVLSDHVALLVDTSRRMARLQRRTLALEGTRRHLERFSRAVSHDLRAPLRAIDGFCQILVEDHGEQLDDEGRRVAAVVRTNATKMGRLIDDLTEWSLADRAVLHKGPTD